MTPHDYWEGDCTLTCAYREAWKHRLKKENRDMWLQGLYFYSALCDVSPVLHAFAKRGTEPEPYFEEPVALTEQEVKERKERVQRRKYEEMRLSLTSWANEHNRKIAEKAENEVRVDE